MFDLLDRDLVVTTLRPDWEHIMRAAAVNSDVDLVSFDLHRLGAISFHLDACSEMVLERVTSDTVENVYETVIAQLRKQRLFVAERVLSDDTWRRVEHFCLGQQRVRLDAKLSSQDKAVAGSAVVADSPFKPLGCRRNDGIGKRSTIFKRVDQVAKVLRDLEAEFVCRGVKYRAVKFQRCLPASYREKNSRSVTAAYIPKFADFAIRRI